MSDECKYPNCVRPIGKAFGYCNAHYIRHSQGKDMEPPIREPYGNDSERFWQKVDKTETCWLWTGAKQNGYGICRSGGAARLAHRVSYTWENGEIPEGVQLDHMCHNRACVNPSHLRFADAALNGQNRARSNKNSKSGVRGVYWCNTYGHFVAKGMLDRKPHHIGIFHDLNEAAEAVSIWRKENMPYSILDQTKKETA